MTPRPTPLRVLALEAYYGGSHRAFLDGWSSHSRHDWTLLTLPAHAWKWRMRHAALTFSEAIQRRAAAGEWWDVLFASDMLNLIELRGLSHRVASLPAVLYFHENQLTYPNQRNEPRDLHFAFTNFVSAAAADAVWFNSGFHRDEFLSALRAWVPRFPDYQPTGMIDQIHASSDVQPPGIAAATPRDVRAPGPLRILWAARWEHDKGPGTFFAALRKLKSMGVPFKVSVLGQQFRSAPDVFAAAKGEFANEIQRWGFAATRADYDAELGAADVFVSTAIHEFFGISAVEAMRAGAYPLLPDRLAYPELLQTDTHPAHREQYLYDGTVSGLAARLAELATRHDAGMLWQGDPGQVSDIMSRFDWERRAPSLDRALEQVTAAS